MLSSKLKRLVFGAENFHPGCTVGLPDPQREVAVRLHWMDRARDVTHNHAIACAHPFRIGVGFERDDAGSPSEATLRFVAGAGGQLLGEIGLDLKESIPLGDERMLLFGVRSCRNYCLPRHQLWSQYLRIAYKDWRKKRTSASQIELSRLERHSMSLAYVCPRPVVLVSVVDQDVKNIFPMDLIGPIGTQHFSLALHATSAVLPPIERSQRIGLSSVPSEEARTAYRLGKNHRQSGIEWEGLPFPLTCSSTFRLPVPQFALRTLELEIELVRNLGSHTLLLGRVLDDRRCRDGAQLHFIHGFYQIWRDGHEPLSFR